jgi:hypothetical protein
MLEGSPDVGYIGNAGLMQAKKPMVRIPQKYAPLVYGVIQAAITTAVATAVATHQMMTVFNAQFLGEWLFAWGLAFLTMLPVVIFVHRLFSAAFWL